MHDRPIGLLHAASRALASAVLRLAYELAVLLLTTMRALLVAVLRLLRPFLMLPLLLAMVAGTGIAVAYACESRWLDTTRALMAAIGCAALLAVYTRAAVWLDPEHFARWPVLSWRRYL